VPRRPEHLARRIREKQRLHALTAAAAGLPLASAIDRLVDVTLHGLRPNS
jgi:hypothetical protein